MPSSYGNPDSDDTCLIGWFKPMIQRSQTNLKSGHIGCGSSKSYQIQRSGGLETHSPSPIAPPSPSKPFNDFNAPFSYSKHKYGFYQERSRLFAGSPRASGSSVDDSISKMQNSGFPKPQVSSFWPLVTRSDITGDRDTNTHFSMISTHPQKMPVDHANPSKCITCLYFERS